MYFRCKSTGGNATESRPVADFTEMYVYDKINVVITQDTINSIVVEAGDHLLSEITTDIVGGQLNIHNNNSCNFVRSYKREITIYVHAKNLQKVDQDGSGNITSTNSIISDSFVSNNWTSGNVSLSLNVNHAYAGTHVAAGDVTFTGSANDLYVWDICEGIIHCENLAAKSVTVVSKGTGDCYVNASNELITQLRGQGFIYYYGNPSTVQSVNTGTGQLVHLQ